MRSRPQTIRRVLPGARSAWIAAVAGTTRRGSCRSAYRGRIEPGDRRSDLGFRVSLEPSYCFEEWRDNSQSHPPFRLQHL